MIQKIIDWDYNILIKINGFFAKHNFANKFFAEYLTYIVPIILLILWFMPTKSTKKVAMRAFTSIILAWPILSLVIGHFVHRTRPFDMSGVQELVFHRPSVSFPSDHAATLFAMAMSFWLSGYKKLSYLMFAVAITISFFRIATGIHWPTDIFAGIIIGISSAFIINLLDKYLDPIYNFIIKIMQKVKLA